MSGEAWQMFETFGLFITLLFFCGLYCLLVTRNLIRAIIGLELLIKAVTLLFVVVGYVTNNIAFIQSLVITIIVIEVIVAVVAGGVALRVFRHIDSLDVNRLKNLRG